METKTYKANTNISINVMLATKKNLHIAFVPQSDGSSVFVTSDEDLQMAIESHRKFGQLFRLESVHKVSTQQRPARMTQQSTSEDGSTTQGPNNETTADNKTIVDETETDVAEVGNDTPADEALAEEHDTETISENEEVMPLREVEVSDISAAKDYLADNFDLTRSSMRTQKAVIAAAAKYGIQFKFLS